MSELERLVVLLALAVQAGGVELGDEAQALLEVIHTRAESTRDYHLSRRGIDALERIHARDQDRDVDYRAARLAADEIIRAQMRNG